VGGVAMPINVRDRMGMCRTARSSVTGASGGAEARALGIIDAARGGTDAARGGIDDARGGTDDARGATVSAAATGATAAAATGGTASLSTPQSVSMSSVCGGMDGATVIGRGGAGGRDDVLT
jgi:hypothetical protein